MTALILKDIATLKKTLLLTITICVALAIYGIYENAIFMIPSHMCNDTANFNRYFFWI